MNRKTEESRIAYNKIAFEYDMSRKGQYTRFHIDELSNTIDLREGDDENLTDASICFYKKMGYTTAGVMSPTLELDELIRLKCSLETIVSREGSDRVMPELPLMLDSTSEFFVQKFL